MAAYECFQKKIVRHARWKGKCIKVGDSQSNPVLTCDRHLCICLKIVDDSAQEVETCLSGLAT